MSAIDETVKSEKSASLKRLEELVSREFKTISILIAAFIVVLFSGLEPTLQEVRNTAGDFTRINRAIQDNENQANELVRMLVAEEEAIKGLELFRRKYPTNVERDKEHAELAGRYRAAQKLARNLEGLTNANQAVKVLEGIFKQAGATNEVLRSEISRTNNYYSMAGAWAARFQNREEQSVSDVAKAYVNEERSEIDRWNQRVTALGTLPERMERLPVKWKNAMELRTGLELDRSALRKESAIQNRKVDFELFGLKLHITPFPAALLWLGLSVILIGYLAQGRAAVGSAWNRLSDADRLAAEELFPIWKKVVFPDLFPAGSLFSVGASITIPFLIIAAQFRVVWIVSSFGRYLGTSASRATTICLVLLFGMVTAWFAGWWLLRGGWTGVGQFWNRVRVVIGGAVVSGGYLLLLGSARFEGQSAPDFSASRLWVLVGVGCLAVLTLVWFPILATTTDSRPIRWLGKQGTTRRMAIIGVCLIGLAPTVFLRRAIWGQSGLRKKNKQQGTAAKLHSGFFSRQNSRRRQIVFHYVGKGGQTARSDRVPTTLSEREISQKNLPPILSGNRPKLGIGLSWTGELSGGYLRQTVVFARALCMSADARAAWLWKLMGNTEGPEGQERCERIRKVVQSYVIPADGIRNMTLFADKLLAGGDELSRYIAGRLEAKTREELRIRPSGGTLSPELRTRLLEGLNRIVAGRFFGDNFTMDPVRLREETRRLLEENPRGPCCARLNRLLLEDAYPDEFVASTSLSGQCHAFNLKVELADALGHVIDGTNIYSKEQFGRSEDLPGEIPELLESDPRGDELRHSNLLLLAHAFPAHIVLNSVPRRRMQLAASSWAFEEAALHILAKPSADRVEGNRAAKALEPEDTLRVCKLLMSAVVHDAIFKSRLPKPPRKRRPSFRLYDLLAGVSIRFKHHDQFAQMLQFVDQQPPGERLLFQSRLAKWNDSRSAWRIQWRDRKDPILWRSTLGTVVF